MKKILIAVSALSMLLAPLSAMAAGTPVNGSTRLILTDLVGKDVDITALTAAGKKPLLLFFWTSWCPFCLKELRQLGQREAELGTAVDMFVVNAGENKSTVERVAKNYKLDMRVFLDEKMIVSERYGVIGVPTFVLIDHGSVAFNGNSFPETEIQKLTQKRK